MKLVPFLLCLLMLLSVNGADSAIAITLPKTKVPAGFEKVDQVIKIGPLHGNIKFDKEVIHVKAGQKIKIEFRNADEMPHNMVILKSGSSTKAIGDAALMMGAAGLKAGYIPKSDKIMAFIGMIEPGKGGVLYFQAPNKKSILPYVCTIPGHYFTMIGVIKVGMKKTKVVKKRDELFDITITDKPYIYRSGINISGLGKKPYSIAVGLPGGMNYSFDAESCTVTSAWKGKFLSAQGDWDGRGGKGAQVIGKVFYTNRNKQSVHLPNKATPKFSGYRVHKGFPTFIYYLGTSKVQLSVSVKDGKLVKKIIVNGATSGTYVSAPKANVTVNDTKLVNGKINIKEISQHPGMLIVNVEVAP